MNESPSSATRSATAPLSVRAFAWRVAGPRDFVINLAVNSTIPFWLFRGLEAVPLTGRHSVASMVLPMSLLLCTLTTFFGWFNAVKERRAGVVVPALEPGTRWAGAAWRDALWTGLPAFAITLLVVLALARWAPGLSVGYWTAVLGIGVLAGTAGFVLHALAVERGGAIGIPRTTPGHDC